MTYSFGPHRRMEKLDVAVMIIIVSAALAAVGGTLIYIERKAQVAMAQRNEEADRAIEFWKPARLLRVCADGTKIYDINGTRYAARYPLVSDRPEKVDPSVMTEQVCP